MQQLTSWKEGGAGGGIIGGLQGSQLCLFLKQGDRCVGIWFIYFQIIVL